MNASDFQKSGSGYDFGVGLSLAQNPALSAIAPLTVTGGGNSGKNTAPNWNLIALIVAVVAFLIVWFPRR